MIDFKRLKDLREDHDLTQQEMANILKVSRSSYSLWELGINIIPLSKLCMQADYFDVSIDYLLGLTNKKNSKSIIKGLELKILGDNLKEIRKKNNLSQDDMANILGVTQACVTRYEKGLIEISTSNLYKYSRMFKISLSCLCGKNKDIPVKQNS